MVVVNVAVEFKQTVVEPEIETEGSATMVIVLGLVVNTDPQASVTTAL